MKFGRVLRTTAEDLPDLPELQALFAAYKHLKKAVKRLPDKGALRGGGGCAAEGGAAAAGGEGARAPAAGANVAAAGPSGAARAGGAAAEGGEAPGGGAAAAVTRGELDAAEAAFAATLGDALAQMNELFLEKEVRGVGGDERGVGGGAGRSRPSSRL
jgi:hypothetical protein